MHQTPELLELAILSDASVRLQNALQHAYKSGILQIFTRVEYLREAIDGVPHVFHGIPNLGRKSLAELDELVRSNRHHISPREKSKLEEEVSPECNVVVSVSEMVPESPVSFHNILQSCLSEREQWVLQRRYGLDGNARLTLDELGGELHVTRERVRQIEAKALRRLKSRKHHLLAEFLDIQKDTALQLLFSDVYWFAETDINLARSKLGGECVLAIDACVGSIETWLTQNAIAYRHGWLSPGLCVDAVKSLANGISSIIRSKLLITPVAVVARNLNASIEAVCAAIDIHPSVRRHLGVMCVPPIGIRSRRAISLMRAMARGPAGKVYPIDELLNICIKGEPGSSPSARDVAIVLAQHKHLFINCFENGWATTVHRHEFVQFPTMELRDEAPVIGSTQQRVVDCVSADLSTNKRFLKGLLKNRGPMFLKEITEEFVSANHADASPSSVGPTLLLNDEFIRLAPHVYALSSDWKSGEIKANALDRLLFDEFQLAIYVQACWAGEPKNLYPAWTRARELAWARWALSCGNTILLNSLLAVADPQSWPTSSPDIQVWMDRKIRNGNYSLLEKLSVRLEETITSFLDFLAASLWAQQQGHISWIGVNRTTGCRVNDRHAAATLALLVHHKIVEAPIHWQMSHGFASGGDTIIGGMLDHVLSGAEGWPTKLSKISSDVGWLSGEDCAALLDRYATDIQAVESSDPPADEILAALRARERDKLIDSLM
jgi:hypothetical protein